MLMSFSGWQRKLNSKNKLPHMREARWLLGC